MIVMPAAREASAKKARQPPGQMSAVGRVFRTTAVKLSLVYLAVFSLVTIALVTYLLSSINAILTSELSDAVNAEVRELLNQYEIGGVLRVVTLVDSRSRQPGAGLYLITDPSGNPLVGNISDLPEGVVDRAGTSVRAVPYRRLSHETDANSHHVALVRVFTLDNGFKVLVGRDVGEREKFSGLIGEALRAVLVVTVLLGLVTWWFVSRSVLKRIDQVTHTANRIVAGDLSGRLSLTGSNDEFDRLAVGLNHMFDRLTDLMRGLKEVSDNIAHDLKTPLTRLRNRAEEALADTGDPERAESALEGVIEDCDSLIRTFDALLTIARVESGNQTIALSPVDLSDIVGEVSELYEPLADEEGVELTTSVAGEKALANRELLSQALANLLDNALKYGRPAEGPARITLSVTREAGAVLLAVADNGPGIPETDRGRVLERFVRLERSRNSPGSGLGLSLVAAIARQHGAPLVLSDASPGLKAIISLQPA
ncbi:MAG: ATP-binding protein [Ancalomicrobiaceae bacterium]|nr:ATP-binding protein [Ancalomicrobiaceae bacterium]